jgi:NAD-dependent deacetylase
MKKIAVITGAGISAESGIRTFRDAGGLWEGHDVMEVATPEGWVRNQEVVLDFYNQRRKQLLGVQPNPAHSALVRLEEKFRVSIITQNIDDLHERAGSSDVVHLHGELLKARSSVNPHLVYHWEKDILPGDKCSLGSQLRPHVVWFGEPVPMMETAIMKVQQAEIVLVIGTSLQVYPAAGLIDYSEQARSIIYVDPRPGQVYLSNPNIELRTIAATAGKAVPNLVKKLLDAS